MGRMWPATNLPRVRKAYGPKLTRVEKNCISSLREGYPGGRRAPLAQSFVIGA